MHRHLSGVIKGANKDFRPRPVHLTLQNHENFQHEEKRLNFMRRPPSLGLLSALVLIISNYFVESWPTQASDIF